MCTLVRWNGNLSLGKNISFKPEHKKCDKFAVAGKTLLKGRIGTVTLGYTPRKFTRRTWYAIQEGAIFQAVVYDTEAKPSLLIQGWLEIPIKIKIIWSQKDKLLKFKVKVEEVKYPVTGKYTDDSKSILNKIGVHSDEDDDADNDVAHDDVEELLEVEEQYRGDEDVEIIDLEK